MTCNCAWSDDAEFVPLEDFIPDALLRAPNAPDEVVANAVRLAAIEFCRTAMPLARRLCVDAQEGVADYHLTLPDEYHIVAIRSVCVGDTEYFPLGMASCTPRRAWHHRRFGYTYSQSTGVVLDPPPLRDAPGCLCISAIVQPGQRTCTLPRELYDDYLETLAAGAAARLLLMSTASWFDRTGAGIQQRIFRSGMVAAKSLHMRGQAVGPLMMQAPRFI